MNTSPPPESSSRSAAAPTRTTPGTIVIGSTCWAVMTLMIADPKHPVHHAFIIAHSGRQHPRSITRKCTSKPWTPASARSHVRSPAQPAGCAYTCPASSRWQVLGLGEVGDLRVGVAEVDLDRAVPGQVLVGSDGVVLDPVALDVDGQVDRVGDLFEEQPLVLQGAEAAFA